jgi:hypothetical protein
MITDDEIDYLFIAIIAGREFGSFVTFGKPATIAGIVHHS